MTCDFYFDKKQLKDFNHLLREKKISIKVLSRTLGYSDSWMSNKISIETPFDYKQVKIIRDRIGVTSNDIDKYFFPLEGKKFSEYEIVGESMAKHLPEVKRISTGYECQFTDKEGKVHSSYGKTELEAKLNKDKRMKELVSVKQTPKKDVITLQVSKNDAFVLYNHLFQSLMHNPDTEDYSVIRDVVSMISDELIGKGE